MMSFEQLKEASSLAQEYGQLANAKLSLRKRKDYSTAVSCDAMSNGKYVHLPTAEMTKIIIAEMDRVEKMLRAHGVTVHTDLDYPQRTG